MKPTVKGRHNGQYRVSLEARSCVIEELFGSIAALLGSASHKSYAVVDCIPNRTRCTRRLVS
jgi:hypothetical protein